MWGEWCCITAGGDFDGLLLRASDSELEILVILELGPSGLGGPWSGRDLKIVEDGSGMEGSLGWKMTLKKLDVAEADFREVGCDGG